MTYKCIPTLIRKIDEGWQPRHDKTTGRWEFHQRAKPESPCRVFDGDGLCLIHKPGTASTGWRFRYQWAGSKKEISLGTLSKVGLAKARELRHVAQTNLIDGQDPSQVRKAAELQRRAQEQKTRATFSSLIWPWSDTYHRREQLADTTKIRNERLLRYLNADLGRLSVSRLTRKAIKRSVERIAAENGTESAHRALSLCHLFCESLVVDELISGDPTPGIRSQLGKIVDTPRAALIEPKAVGALLRAVWSYQGLATTIAAMKLLPLTMLRPGELRRARWDEIDFDNAEWIVPVARMKTRNTRRVDHLVPLSRQVIRILADLRELDFDELLVFPSLRTNRPLSENAFRVALLNLGYDGTQHHAHGWRKTASSLLARQGFDQRWIDKQLAHAVPGISGKYQLYDFAQERRLMMQHWADYCDQLRIGEHRAIAEFHAA